MKKLALIAVLCIAMAAGAYEGYAPLATGGAGGTVVTVTNLNDSGAGSFRAAVLALNNSPTIIQFSVGGAICTTSEVRITHSNVTVDGSTAPSPGITMVGSGMYAILGIDTNVDANVIVQHMRFRNSGLEGIQLWGGSKIIIDHCSVSGTGDGALDINQGANIVVSRNIFANCMEVHKAHGTYVSAHHNLYSWNNRRQPRIFGGGPYWDFRNNIIEYWQNTGTNCVMSNNINIKNNWYGDPSPMAVCNVGFWSINDCTDVYTGGNYSNCGQNIDAMGNRGTPVTEPSVTTTDAATAYNSVLADCGAQPTDAIDQYYIDGGGTTPPGVGSCGGGSSSGGGGGGEGTYLSPDGDDGYVIETTETSGVGGTYKTTTTYIGDTTSKQQQRAIFSFDTSAIPDGVTVTSATFSMKRLGVSGTPTSLGSLTVDIKTGYFGAQQGVRGDDFAAAATASNVATLSYPASNGAFSEGALDSTGRAAVNKTGLTQLRVRFATDDDNDTTADYLNIYDTGSQPSLEVIWN